MSGLIGQHLGQYEITALLGEGGMATVYRAYQTSMKRDVAIKVIKHNLIDNSEFVKRFEREAQTVATLSHIHILKVFDYGQQENLVYLVMELLTGGSLANLILRGPLSVEMTTRLLDQIAAALDYAHQKGIIHRDLKPQNVLLDEAGNAHLTDFGIVKLMTELTVLTQSGAAMGTPAYMAPEQWRGDAVDARLDTYALGVMLFEMLTGVLPFVADTPASMMYAHIYQPPPPLRNIRPDLPVGIEQVISRALAKDREQRYQSAGQMAAEFKAAASQQVAAAPTSQPMAATLVGEVLPTHVSTPPRQPGRRVPLAAFVVGGIVLIGILAFVLLRGGPIEPGGTPPPATNVALVPTTLIRTMPALTTAAAAVLSPSGPPVATASSPTPMLTIPTAMFTPPPTHTPTLTASPTDTHTPTPDPRTFGRIAMFAEDRIEIVDGLEKPRATVKLGILRLQSPEISWSPDGTRLVFAAFPDKSTGQPQLYIAQVDGTNVTQLTNDQYNNTHASWSPNGNLIAFHSGCDLRFIRPEGTLLHRVEAHTPSGPGCVHELRWSPDSEWLAFVGTDEARHDPTEIWVIHQDGQNLQRIYSGPKSGLPWEAMLAWNPDGSRIFYQLGSTSLQIDTNCFKKKAPCGADSVSPYSGLVRPSWLPNYFPQWAGENVPRFAFLFVEISKPLEIHAEQKPSSPVIGTLPGGSIVHARVESANGHIEVMSSSGQLGWVEGNELGFQRLIYKGTLQLRSGPGTDYESLGTIASPPTGEPNCWATARDSTGRWLQVICQRRLGWTEYPGSGGVADRDALPVQTVNK